MHPTPDRGTLPRSHNFVNASRFLRWVSATVIVMRALLTTLVVAFLFVGTASADRWDPKGWLKLGEQRVNGRVDKDRIAVGRHEGKFTKLTIVVEDSDIELIDFDVKFVGGGTWNPRVKHYFKEGARSRVIDLPGDERVIQYIDLRYKNLPGGGAATVAVWGWKTGEAGGRPIVKSAWKFDNTGWQLLGERTVDYGRRADKDRIAVGKYKGKFEKIAIVVLDSDLELLDFSVAFARGPEWRPAVKHVFREGERSRVIDFPGDDRALKYIDMRYKNLPGGGKAKVQVWGR